MSVEPIGVLVALLGLYILRAGPDFGIGALLTAHIMMSAAAIKLPALGGSSIQPVYVLLPFYIVAVANTPGAIDKALRSVAFPRAGFWLAVFCGFGLISALFLPRVFQGAVQVFAIARDITGRPGVVTAFLGPSGGNITQSVYLLSNVVVFAAVSAHVFLRGQAPVVRAVLVAACVNIVFAFLDIATYASGTTYLLDFIRNANYRMLADGDIGGFKRIVGSFPEASPFGLTTTAFFVFSMELVLRRTWAAVAAPIAVVSFCLALLSTSSSAYLGLGCYCLLVGLRSIFILWKGRAHWLHVLIAVGAPLVFGVVLLWAMLVPSVWQPVQDLIDSTIVNKLGSQSGIERAAWNHHAFKAFTETWMLGTGVGSVRASSFILAVLANMGIIGFVALLGFLTHLVLVLRRDAYGDVLPASAAGAWACAIFLLPAIAAQTGVDLGSMFFTLFALSMSRYGAIGYGTVDRMQPQRGLGRLGRRGIGLGGLAVFPNVNRPAKLVTSRS